MGYLIDYNGKVNRVFLESRIVKRNNSRLQNLPATFHRHRNIDVQRTGNKYRNYRNSERSARPSEIKSLDFQTNCKNKINFSLIRIRYNDSDKFKKKKLK